MPIISLRIYGSIFKAQAAACDFRCSFSFSERRTKTAVVLSIKNHLISLPTGGVLGALPLTSGRFDSKMPCLLIQMLTHLFPYPRPIRLRSHTSINRIPPAIFYRLSIRFACYANIQAYFLIRYHLAQKT